jgi:hypothetical protein
MGLMKLLLSRSFTAALGIVAQLSHSLDNDDDERSRTFSEMDAPSLRVKFRLTLLIVFEAAVGSALARVAW